MHIIGLLRVRNEARWIEQVVRAIVPVCEQILILDDHSDDGTPDICAAIPKVTVYQSEDQSHDESRDKDFLLSKAYELVPDEHKKGNPKSPWWALLIDGDEELMEADQRIITELAESEHHAFHLRIPYLWNDENHIRIDGVYAHMAAIGRPSMFRLMNDRFRFQRTPFGNGNNFHCSSVPQEMLHHAKPSSAGLKHWGYMLAEDRIRKYYWYNEKDPGNVGEDEYRHMVIGDLFPADSVFRHAGPLKVIPLMDEKETQKPTQINKETFSRWVAAMQSAGIGAIPYRVTRANNDMPPMRGADSEA
jgi:glycosyltransferase involved in cell wall biosynthesis